MENQVPVIETGEINKSTLPRWVYISVFILFGFVAVYFFMVRPPSEFKTGEIFSVEEGDSLRKLSFKLKESGFIRSRVAFETLVIFYGDEKHLVVGDYIFPNRLSVAGVARKMATGDRQTGLVKITIPEGFDNQEIAEVCDLKLKNFNKERFLSLASGEEGYLFPDTYFFSTTDDESSVMQLMSKNFKNKTKEVFDAVKASGGDTREIVIMASILEEEASGEADREIISGILWHRIKIGMPLQVDAVPTTYKEKGLPDAPVSNPGLDTIKAAFYPKDSKYL
ncbi:MAG TPA: endolytic transglycosylase MltG, partial [Candidatus Paceibacterota bacterium]